MIDEAVAPRPWTVDETPNGVYLRAANGLRFAIMLGLPGVREATGHFIADNANRNWLAIVRSGTSDTSGNFVDSSPQNSPKPVDGE